MMLSLEEDDVSMMIETTFSIVVLSWDALQLTTRERACAMMDHLATNHATVIQEKIALLPSLATVPQLSRLEAGFSKMRAEMDVRQKFQAFSRRCQRENATVVTQALRELLPYLRRHQTVLHELAVSEQSDPLVSGLMRSLLDSCVKFAGTQPRIADLCAQCIGLIGCLDPNRVEAVRENQDILMVSNFEKAEEAVDWVVFFLQEILVKAFMSATNPRSQAFLGYAMQELLKFCNLDTTITSKGRDAQTNANYRRWIALPEAVRNSLTPFLTSNYVITANAANVECTYPIFPSKPSHGLWLRTFVVDLLQKGEGENAQMVFPVCSRVVRGQDISIASFLFPFVALNVIVSGMDEHGQQIGNELLEVLRYDEGSSSHSEKENLKLCSEVSDGTSFSLSSMILRIDRAYFTSLTTFPNGCRRRRNTLQSSGIKEQFTAVEHTQTVNSSRKVFRFSAWSTFFG